MIPKVHFTLHSRMSSSRWMSTPLWLSESLRPFLYSSSVHSCDFSISSASVRSIPFLSFIVPIFAWSVPLVSLIFLKRYFLFYCFPLFLCIVHLWRHSYLSLLFSGLLYLAGYYLSFSPLPFSSLFSQLFVKSSQTTTLPSCIPFLSGWFWSLLPVQCYESLSKILQSLCLLVLIPWIYLPSPLYNHSRCDLGHTWMV